MSVPGYLAPWINGAEANAWAQLETSGAPAAFAALRTAIATARTAALATGISSDQFATAVNAMAGPGWNLGMGGQRDFHY